MVSRDKTRVVKVANLLIGGKNPVIIQSMTNTRTKDIEKTVEQIKTLESVGCQLVRVAVLTFSDADAIREIKKFINIPIVADIHFDYQLALRAIDAGVDKIRINPGNIGSDDNVKKVVDACIKHHIPIRIGVNSGSIEKHILKKYGKPTAKAMVESAQYHVHFLEQHGFKDIIISLKASSVPLTIEAYRLAAQTFEYPLHLGVTEAGTKFSGTIASSIGLGVLLNEGIGSTIRVSLTAKPKEEIYVAKEILANLNMYQKPKLVSCPTCGRIQYDMIPIVEEMEAFLHTIKKPITLAIMGCVVNGPGEAKEANIAVAGGKKEALLFIDGKKIKKIKQEDLVSSLKQIILDYEVKL